MTTQPRLNNVAQQPKGAPSTIIRRSSPDHLDIAIIQTDLDIGLLDGDTGERQDPETVENYHTYEDDYESILDPMKNPTRQPPPSSRRVPFKRHSPLDYSSRSSNYSQTNRGSSMYTHLEHEEPFIRQVTKGLIIMGGYRDLPNSAATTTTKMLRPAYQKELLVERLTSHIETINDLIGVHSRRRRAKKSFGKRLVSFLLFKPPPHNSARFEDASNPCTSTDPFDHLKLPQPLISAHLPLSQQYYRHLFDMVDHVPMLHDDFKIMISRGFAQAQVLEVG